jgi:uncharacterized protein (DUF1697 family)
MTGKRAAREPASQRFILLLRGINVNPTTRVSMADLRDILTGLGYASVRTILQSGNVILDAPEAPDVATLEAAIASRTGVKSSVVVLSVREFRALVDANPLLDADEDRSRLAITFLAGDIVPSRVDRPTESELEPERLVVTKRAIYHWYPDGFLKSKLKAAWWRQFDPVTTARNVRTVDRILAAADLE